MGPEETAVSCSAILDELERAVVGRRRTLELVLTGILAGGHVLLEDLPGLGKTLIAAVVREGTRPGLRPHPVHPGPAALRRGRRAAV
ncbi:MAG: hypothetical protein ACRDNT_29055 [Streptosporangiaceae bacterium]